MDPKIRWEMLRFDWSRDGVYSQYRGGVEVIRWGCVLVSYIFKFSECCRFSLFHKAMIITSYHFWRLFSLMTLSFIAIMFLPLRNLVWEEMNRFANYWYICCEIHAHYAPCNIACPGEWNRPSQPYSKNDYLASSFSSQRAEFSPPSQQYSLRRMVIPFASSKPHFPRKIASSMSTERKSLRN